MIIILDEITPDGVERSVSYSQDQLMVIARRLSIPAVTSFSGHLKMRRVTATEISISGVINADVKQACVVTLEDFEQPVSDQFDLRFTDQVPDNFYLEKDVIIDGDTPEILETNIIDLAELCIQQLALALDPHPRAPGATIDLPAGDQDDDDSGVGARTGEAGPFAVLKHLRGGDK